MPGDAPAYHGAAPAPALKRTNGLGKAAMVAVGATAVATVVTALVQRTVTDEAERFLAGGVSDTDFIESIAGYALLSVLQGVGVVVSAVLVIIWMFRVARNHRTLHRGGTWGPGWAIGGWFLPPLLYVIPTLMFNELWKASDPDVPVGGDWRSGRGTPLVPIWFVTYSVLPIVMMFFQSNVFSGFGAAEEDLARQIIDDQDATLASGLVAVAGAVSFIALARALADRHQRFTGER